MAYKAGSLYVDVFPTLKGAGKAITNNLSKNLAQAGKTAGKAYSDNVKSETADTGNAVAKSFTGALQKSIPALKVQANAAGEALAAATDKSTKATNELSGAQSRLTSASNLVLRAEQNLAAARRSGDPTRIAEAEAQLVSAREHQKEASVRVEKATVAASRAYDEYETAAVAAKKATQELEAAQRKAAAEQAKPGGFRSLMGSVKDAWGQALGGLKGAFPKTTAVASAAFGKIRSAATSLVPVIGGVATAVGAVLTKAFTGGWSRLTTLENTQAVLKGMGKTGKEIKQIMDAANDSVVGTAFSLDAGAKAAQMMNQAGIKAGSDLNKVMKTLTAMATVAGGDIERVTLVMSQIKSKGRLMGDDILQLNNMNIPALAWIAEDLGKSTEEVQKLASQGEISFSMFEQSMSKHVGNAAKEVGKTTTSSISNMFTSVSRFGAALLEPVMAPIREGAGKIKGLFDTVTKGIIQARESGAAGGGLVGVFAPLAGLITGKLIPVVNTFLTKIPILGEFIVRLSPNIAKLLGPIGAVIGLVISLWQQSANFRDSVMSLFSEIGSAFSSLFSKGESTGNALQGVFDAVNNVMRALGDFLAPVVSLLGKILGVAIRIVGVQLGVAFQVIAAAARVVGNVFAWFIDILRPVVSLLSDGIGWALDWVKSKFDNFKLDASAMGFSEDSPILKFFGWIKEKGQAAVDFVTGIPQKLATAFNVFKRGFSFGADGKGGLIEGDTLAAKITMLGAKIGETWTNIIKPAIDGIKSTISEAWNNIIKPVLTSAWQFLVTVFTPIWGVLKTVIASAWAGIKIAINVAWSIISTIFQALWGFVKNILAPVFLWLWKNVISPAFSGIKTAINVAWSAISIIFQAIFTVLRVTLGPVFKWLGRTISWVWNGIKSAIGSVWNWLKSNVFDPMRPKLESMGNAFHSFKDTVASAFKKIKSVAAKPINFVINTVYNNGIKKAFDTIAEKIGAKTRMPRVAPVAGYAKGGVLPGYTPGRDIHRFVSPTGGVIDLSGGEGIIRPDALRALGGARWLNWVNKNRGRGVSPLGDLGRAAHHQAFAKGGVVSFGSWLWDKAVAGVDFLADVVSDPIGAATRLITAPADRLLSQLSNSSWGQIIGGIPKMLWRSIKDFFKGSTASLSGGKGLVASARKAVARNVPYVWGGSSIPPGLDCSGLVYWALNQMGKKAPRLTAAGFQSSAKPVPWNSKVPGDLLFWGNPAHHVAIYSGNGKLIEEPKPGLSAREIGVWGNPTAGRYLFDAGGELPPGISTVMNGTGAPEKVLTESQWQTMRGAAENQVQNNYFNMQGINDMVGTANAVARRIVSVV